MPPNRTDPNLAWHRIVGEIYEDHRRRTRRHGKKPPLPYGTGRPGAEMAWERMKSGLAHRVAAGSTTWLDVLRERVARVATEGDPEQLRVALKALAAAAVTCVEQLDAEAQLAALAALPAEPTLFAEVPE